MFLYLHFRLYFHLLLFCYYTHWPSSGLKYYQMAGVSRSEWYWQGWHPCDIHFLREYFSLSFKVESLDFSLLRIWLNKYLLTDQSYSNKSLGHKFGLEWITNSIAKDIRKIFSNVIESLLTDDIGRNKIPYHCTI